MDIFEYKGRNKRGEIMQGTIESPNSQAVAAWMMNSGIAPIRISLQGDKLKGQPAWLLALQGGISLNHRDLLLFTRQMGTMIKAGVPMLQALAGIQKSTVNKVLVKLISEIRADLDRGVELSGALARHPKFFNEYYVNMVKVGEGSGQLELVFKRLHEQLVFEKHMSQKIKGALRYPTFVIIAIAIAIAIMTLFVIPVFAKVYVKFHASLPFLTLLLLAVSDFAVHYWWLILALIAGAIYALGSLSSSPMDATTGTNSNFIFPSWEASCKRPLLPASAAVSPRRAEAVYPSCRDSRLSRASWITPFMNSASC